MKTSAFIVKNGEVIAEVTTDLKNGAAVEYAYAKTYDNVRQISILVNIKHGKISRAKKYFKDTKYCRLEYAQEIYPGEFYIQIDDEE